MTWQEAYAEQAEIIRILKEENEKLKKQLREITEERNYLLYGE